MRTFTRVLRNPKGMASLVTNYSRVKELQSQGLSLKVIANVFEQDYSKLENFIEVADGLVTGKISFSIDITTKSKTSFEKVADALI